MPKLTMVKTEEIQGAPRGRRSTDPEDLTWYTEQLEAAIESGEALYLELEDDEHPANIQRAFNAAAEAIPTHTVSFVTAKDGKRDHKVRSGEMKQEVYKFYVKVLPNGTVKPRKSRKSA